MSFPDIHSCIKLTSEYEDLKKKYIRVKQQRDSYQNQLDKYKEKSQLENLLKNYVTTRDTYVQTEPARSWVQHGVYVQPRKKEEKVSEVDKTNKLLSMHNQLMRRYEKEVKNNLTHIETITELNLRISDLEKKLKEEKDSVSSLKKDLFNEQTKQARSAASSRNDKIRDRSQSPVTSKRTESGKDYNTVKKECEKLRKENNKLKEELKGLDFGFFEEIEDIKFAFQQSAKLNKEYEKTIKKLCMQLGVPCPNFDKMMKVPS